jgi:hypothetical protein
MKKFFAMVLTLVMVLSMSVVAFAADEVEFTAEPEEEIAHKLVMVQENLDKVLYFAGKMSGYYFATTENYEDAVARIAQCWGFYNTSPIQPTERLPKEYEGIRNGHNGTHHFLIDDFCRAYWTGKLSPTNIWEVARWNIPGLIAHESALAGGQPMEVIDLGDSPADWEVLPWDKAE